MNNQRKQILLIRGSDYDWMYFYDICDLYFGHKNGRWHGLQCGFASPYQDSEIANIFPMGRVASFPDLFTINIFSDEV